MLTCSRITPLLLPLLTLLLLNGCSDRSGALPYPVEIHTAGVGPITPDTPYDAAIIAQMLPGFDVAPYTAFAAGEAHRLLRITRHDRPVMLLSPTPDGRKIAEIAVRHSAVTVKGEAPIGRPFDAFYRDGSDCIREEETLLCPVPGVRKLFYRFALPEQNPERLDTLSVEAILWKRDA